MLTFLGTLSHAIKKRSKVLNINGSEKVSSQWLAGRRCLLLYENFVRGIKGRFSKTLTSFDHEKRVTHSDLHS